MGEQQMPRLGERVRVTEKGKGYELVMWGTVVKVWPLSGSFTLDGPPWARLFRRDNPGVTIERLPDET